MSFPIDADTFAAVLVSRVPTAALVAIAEKLWDTQGTAQPDARECARILDNKFAEWYGMGLCVWQTNANGEQEPIFERFGLHGY